MYIKWHLLNAPFFIKRRKSISREVKIHKTPFGLMNFTLFTFKIKSYVIFLENPITRQWMRVLNCIYNNIGKYVYGRIGPVSASYMSNSVRFLRACRSQTMERSSTTGNCGGGVGQFNSRATGKQWRTRKYLPNQYTNVEIVQRYQ